MRASLQAGIVMALVPIVATAQPRVFGWYRSPTVAPVSFQSSSRIESLMRAGQLYLSLPDAIALTLATNLDLEFQRFLPRIAGTDVLRASGAGRLRGVS